MWAAPQWLREKLFDVKVHDWAEKMWIQRKIQASIAKNNGVEINPNEVSLPGTQTTINQEGSTGPGTAGVIAATTGAVGAGLLAAHLLTATPEAPQPAVSADDVKAKVELYYDDPEKGLIPIAGAADDSGATLQIGGAQ